MILKNGRLLAPLPDGKSSEKGAVSIVQGKIQAVYENGEAAEGTDGEEIVDCGGKTLLPGLIDAHTHIAGLRGYHPGKVKDPISFFLETCAETGKYLDCGFTTIRDCGTPLRVANYVREAYERGIGEGPRIISCGLILMPTEIERSDDLYDIYSFTDSADEGRKAARRELAERGDFVKVMASGSALHKRGIPVQPIMTREEIEAIVEAAKLKDSYVAAHAHGDGAVRLCAEAGVRTVEHASFVSGETIHLLKEKENCYLIPTISAMYQNPAKTSEEYRFLLQKLEEMLKISSACLQKAYESGLEMGFGTDSCPRMDQYEEGIEFRFRSELCGMKNLDILAQATKLNAKILGIDHITGEIRPGLSADLILVDGRPDEDLSVMYRKPEQVFLNGRRVR